MSDSLEALRALEQVGPGIAARLRLAGISAADITDRRIDRSALLEAGVDDETARRIRDAHNLSWSFRTNEGDIEARAAQIEGLGDGERAWVAASGGDWQSRTRPVASTDAVVAPDASWPDRPGPTPVTVLETIDESLASELAEGGIVSVSCLSIADAADVARYLEFDEERVEDWIQAANDYESSG